MESQTRLVHPALGFPISMAGAKTGYKHRPTEMRDWKSLSSHWEGPSEAVQKEGGLMTAEETGSGLPMVQ